MSENDNIQAFNQQLDQLLAGAAVDPGSEGGMHDLDRAAFFDYGDFPGCRGFHPEMHPRPGLAAQMHASTAKHTAVQPVRRPAPAPRRALAALVIALAALLVVFRDPVAASLGRLFGFAYIPGAGFVAVDSVRVLKNPVTQVNGDRSLTVVRGLSAERDVQLWLEYSDVARPADGAWLETADGQRFELVWWGWEPDEPGTRGVKLVFPPLPAEMSQVTLAMSEGWRIPLEWIPASESSLQPANLTVEQPAPTPPPGDATPEPSVVENQAVPCIESADMRLCVEAAARSAQGMELMLEAQSTGELKPGMLQDHTLIAFAAGDFRLRLTDSQGTEYLPSEAIQLFVSSEERLGEGLVFTIAQDAEGQLTLEVPAFFANVPLTSQMVIDLGEDPQPGQEFFIDETIDVAGIPVHFNRAVVEENSRDSLRLIVSSEPVETRDGVTPYIMMMGRPEQVDSGYGEGSENGVLTLSVDLLQPAGKLTGIINLPIIGASVQARGPFYLTFDAPTVLTAATETPQVITGGEFVPLPTGETLPMEAFQYTGRVLQAGDLLAVSVGEDASTLYASSAGGPAEPVVVLPGQVLAVYPHPDRGGLDYVTGALDAEKGNRYEQLYTLRFDAGVPRLLAGSFERMAYGFSWSYDGRWLAYLAPRSGPGESGTRQVHLVDLACRETGECLGQVAPAPDNLDLHDLAWSPVEERLLVMGVPQTQSYGMSDVYTVFIDPEDGSITLTNLTETPEVDDQGAQWLPDGMKVFITCSRGGMESNTYGLCRNDLAVGMDSLVVDWLPYNMRLALLAPDGKTLVDRVPVFENGVQTLRAYDTLSAETRSLVEWPAAKGGFIEPSISPDGSMVGVVEPVMLSLLQIGLADGQNQSVLQVEQPFTWVGWTR